MKFVIRVDGCREIGYGHIIRCFALAQALKDKSHEVLWVTRKKIPFLMDLLEQERIECHVLPPKDEFLSEAAILAELALDRAAEWVITDGYQFETEYQRKIKESGLRLMCIDDIAHCHYVSDVVLNQNLNAENIFIYSCEPYTRLLLGSAYVLLRREFLNRENETKTIPPIAKNLLVTLGGGDAENNSRKVLRAIDLIQRTDFEVRVILGPGYNDGGYLRQDRFKNSSLEFLQNVVSMADQIQWADMAISAGGTTVWELAIMKTPMVLGIVAENQVPVVEQMAALRAAQCIGWFVKCSLNELAATIDNMIHSHELRRSYAAACNRIAEQLRGGINNTLNEILSAG